MQYLLAPTTHENTAVYDEISEYEELKQDKQEKQYENSEVVGKDYVSLKPRVMETMRDHMQSAVSMSSHVVPVP